MASLYKAVTLLWHTLTALSGDPYCARYQVLL